MEEKRFALFERSEFADRPEMRCRIYTASSDYCVSDDLERIGVTQDLVVQKRAAEQF